LRGRCWSLVARRGLGPGLLPLAGRGSGLGRLAMRLRGRRWSLVARSGLGPGLLLLVACRGGGLRRLAMGLRGRCLLDV